MKRGPYTGVAKKNESLISRIRNLKQDHPFWGYRRIWAHLRYVDHLDVGLNRIYRLMQAEGLLVKKNQRLKARRTHNRPKPVPQRPNEWWGIDMTKVMIDGFGWV